MSSNGKMINHTMEYYIALRRNETWSNLRNKILSSKGHVQETASSMYVFLCLNKTLRNKSAQHIDLK